MPEKHFHSLVRSLRRLVGAGDGCGSDRQLLERYYSAHDEEAFAVVVERHARMVWGVCRRMLGNEHETEDAFQAVFMILAIKGASLPEDSVGGWLHEVAWRVAARLRARRRKHELGKADMRTISPTSEEEHRELCAVMDEEIEQLPSKYRRPLVLCYLEGKTYEEAARELGWPSGTVSSRLAKARDLLRGRLVRRGVALSAAAFGVFLSQAAATAAVPPTLMQAAIKSASLAAAGATAGTASAQAASLAGEVIHSMFLTKVKIAVATLLTTAVLAGGGGTLAYQAWSVPDHSTEDTMSQAIVKADHPEPIAEKKEESNQADKEPEKALEKAVACTVEPADVPLVARLVVKKDSYVLDRGGLTAEEFRQRIQNAKTEADLPKPPSVDWELELRNTGKVPLFIWSVANDAKLENMRPLPSRGELLEIAVEFPKTENRAARHTQALTRFPQREIILMPGKSGTFPIQQLVEIRVEGKSMLRKTTYWTEPGNYHLAIRYALAVLPRSEGDSIGLARPTRITSEVFGVEVKSRSEP